MIVFVLPEWCHALLACPDCRRPFSIERTCVCGFKVAAGGQPDLRPQNPKPRSLVFELRTDSFATLEGCTIARPAPGYRGPRAARDSSELFSAAGNAIGPGTRLLDLGCGPRDQALPTEHCGAAYVGIDFNSPAADILADAHAIPFRDGAFDVVLSYAVLEHLSNPFIAAREVARVLRPGGIFVGTVSQGEPFHDSYFHHTAVGVVSVLEQAALSPLRLWPSYDTLHALATMGRYARAHRVLIQALHRFSQATPFFAPRKHFRSTEREKALDELHRAASICFLATGQDQPSHDEPPSG